MTPMKIEIDGVTRVTKETLEDIVDELSEVVDKYNKARFNPHTIQVGDYMYRVLPIYRDLQTLLRKQKSEFLEDFKYDDWNEEEI
jgi:3-methyladenine DNA glycosylase AlkD